MQWSKLKSQVEELFADSVQGRVRLHSTKYRRMHDQEGRAWITLDGEEILNMPNLFEWLYQRRKRAEELAGPHNDPSFWEDQADLQLQQESFFRQGELGDAMFAYLHLSIDDILASENVLIRAIGMLDRRLGKRRLPALAGSVNHPLVRLLYVFRCEAEGIKTLRLLG
jgi:hypothetical protein